MKIATLLFTYNRSYHTEQVIVSLKHNTILPQKLFVFQDGLKQEKDNHEWKKVNSLINSIDWCDKEIIVSEYNKGLANSIVSGINYALKDWDAVIVLEDDCVPTANFISFMQQCFEKYQDNKNVYCVSGYSWPIALKKKQYDVYGCGRISSWGWGTWKDRWSIFEKDYELVKKMKQKEESSRNIALWGRDLEDILIGNIRGSSDSWAVFWALNVISRDGICINPYESMIRNIGMDSSGVHCGTTDRFDVKTISEAKEQFDLPDQIVFLDETKEGFSTLYGSYTAVSQANEAKEKILVYGLGNFFFQNEKTINEVYNIEAFIDKGKQGWFAGKKIIRLSELDKYAYDKILIMVGDIQECMNIARNLTEYNVCTEKILLGHNLIGEDIGKITLSSDMGLTIPVTFDNITVNVRSKDEFNNAKEVLEDHVYYYCVNNDKRDIVIDVGMNIGDAVLYFLNDEKVEKVYAFEPFKETFMIAQNNLRQYLDDSERIEIFQYGISNENSSRIIEFNRDMSCGQSSIASVRDKAYKWYQETGLVKSDNEESEIIEVKDAVEVFLPIIQKHTDCNIILKIDCEGEEYAIFQELLQAGLLSKIDFIMLEWHYKGKEILLDYLNEADFSYWCTDKNKDMGLIYAYRNSVKSNSR